MRVGGELSPCPRCPRCFFNKVKMSAIAMNTVFMLMAQYGGRAVIPVNDVVTDYFPHLSVDKFLRKCAAGEIQLPVVRIDPGTQKTAKGVHLADLARYIDERRAAAQKEARQLAGLPGVPS